MRTRKRREYRYNVEFKDKDGKYYGWSTYKNRPDTYLIKMRVRRTYKIYRIHEWSWSKSNRKQELLYKIDVL